MKSSNTAFSGSTLALLLITGGSSSCSQSLRISDLQQPALVATLSVDFCLNAYAIDAERQGYVSEGCESSAPGELELVATRSVDAPTVGSLANAFAAIALSEPSTCAGLGRAMRYRFISPDGDNTFCVDDATMDRPTPAEELFNGLRAAVSE